MNGRWANVGKRRLASVLRLAALLGLLGTLALSAVVVRVRARVDEAMQNAGATMFSYTRAHYIDAPRELMLNGAALHLISGSTTDSVDALLDVFDARCRRLGGAFGRPLLDGRTPRAGLTPGVLATLDGVLRLDDEHAGYVACFDLGGEPLRPAELARRIRAFLATGDLAQVGDLRFAWARRDADHTSYVAFWSEGSLPLRTIFPLEGDAPGSDLRAVPRPTASRRALSAWQSGEAPMLVSYRAEMTAAELVRQYRKQLTDQGYVVDDSAPGRSTQPPLIIRRGGALAVAIATDEGPGNAVLTLMPLR